MAIHPRRKSLRLSGYDYSIASVYFITICTYQHQRLFVEIEEGAMRLNWGGRAVQGAWETLPTVIPDLLLDVYAIMPDHFHAIFGFAYLGPSNASKKVTDLSSIIRRFKTYSMHLYGEQVAAGRIAPYREHLWQRSYWDRIIRGDADLEKHREYISNNALKKFLIGE